jgi:mannose-6-phosphate isomerase-like protein (cupin superfamily)
VQRILLLEPGRGGQLRNSASEDVLYVVSGAGSFEADSLNVSVRAGSALLAPARSAYQFLNEGPMPLEVVSVLAPQPDSDRVRPDRTDDNWESAPTDVPSAATHEDQETPLPAGKDRFFKLLIDPRYGARHVTQFVGFIERSHAPFHTHTYEEAIYILEGEGVVHIGDDDVPIAAGTSIFLPPGTPHCLENRSDGVLKLLGVFSPPGSPAVHMDR